MRERYICKMLKTALEREFRDVFYMKLTPRPVRIEENKVVYQHGGFDIFALVQGIPIAIEVKTVRSKVVFEEKYEKQYQALKRFYEAGGYSFFLVYNKKEEMFHIWYFTRDWSDMKVVLRHDADLCDFPYMRGFDWDNLVYTIMLIAKREHEKRKEFEKEIEKRKEIEMEDYARDAELYDDVEEEE